MNLRLISACLAAAAVHLALPAQAALKVLATTADWGALTTELGGDKVNVYTATNALQDVHRVDAKPSLVARARTADLVVATGAELEIGWLPVLLQESGNPKIQPGTPGYFEATSGCDCWTCRRRSIGRMGDIHPLGNPHVQLDPHNIAAGRQSADARLAAIDPANAAYYQARGADFLAALEAGDRTVEGRGRAAEGRAASWSCIATRCICVTGSGSTKSRPSSPSRACRRARAISPNSSAS